MFKHLPQVRYAPDIVFQMNVDEYKKIPKDKMVGFSIINIKKRKKLSTYHIDYLTNTVNSIKLFESMGYKCCLMSFCENEGDLQAIDDIKRQLTPETLKNVNTYNYQGNIKEALSLIASFELFIASRFHTNVLAISLGIPVMPVIYSDKTQNMLKDIQLDELLVNMKNLHLISDKNTVIKAFHNKKDVKQISLDATKHFDKLAQYLILLSNSYNGAWWYVQTYVLLILLTPLMMNIVQKNISLLVFLGSGIIYFLSYLQRIRHVIAFIVGMLFAKEHIYTKIQKQLNNISYKNVLCICGVIILVIIHSFIESMIIAPIIAIIFICLFSLMQKSNWLQKLLLYIGQHSTNIWLIHMFFYISIFPELIFAPKYPVLIFLNLLIFSLLSSYIINLIYWPVLKIIDTYQQSQSNFLHLFTRKSIEK